MVEQQDKPGFLVKLNNNIVAPLLLMATGISAFMADRAARIAEHTRQSVDNDISRREQNRADIALDREYQLKVAELTMAALESNNVNKQRALLVVVKSLPEPMGSQMTKALTFSGDKAVAADAQLTLAATRDFTENSPSGSDAARGARAPVARQASQTPIAVSQLLERGASDGWDVDVFWCQGTAAENSHYGKALQLANKLAANAKQGVKISDYELGRVRLRPISALTNNAPGYNIFANVIRAEDRESAQADALRKFAANGGQPLIVQRTTQRTSFYLSVFFCGATA